MAAPVTLAPRITFPMWNRDGQLLIVDACYGAVAVGNGDASPPTFISLPQLRVILQWYESLRGNYD